MTPLAPLAIVPRARRWLLPVAVAVTAAAAFAGGLALKGRLDEAAIERLRTEIARMASDHAAEKQAAAEATVRKLAAAAEAERAAVHALTATRARLTATQKRLKEALYALPTAGHCGLSDGAVWLLDSAAGGNHVPEGATEPDRAAAEPAADAARPAASEAAVGAWIGEAIRAYDECRARLDAIRQWDEVTNGR